MPNLYIITITNYDIFGLDRMVYTFKNTCVEAPELCYNDRVRLVYFNTSGSVCDDNSLRNFLKYIDDSSDSNAVDDNTREIHKYVRYIRNSYGGDYVTVGDWIDSIVDEKCGDLKADLAAKDDEIAAKDDEIAAMNEEIARLQAELDKLKA